MPTATSFIVFPCVISYTHLVSSIQFSPLTDWVIGGDMTDDSAEILFQSFLQEVIVSRSGVGRDVQFLVLYIQYFLCRPRRRLPFQGDLKDGFGVVACDMPEPCKFPSIDSCQRRFLWTDTEVDLASHSVVGLVLQVGDAEKVS